MYLCNQSVQPETGLFGNGALITFQWSVSGAWQDWSAGARHPNASFSFLAWQSAVNSKQQLPPPSPQIWYQYLASLICTGLPNSNTNHQPCLRKTTKTKATLGRHCQNPHKLKGEGHIQGLLVEHSTEDKFCLHWNEQNFDNKWQVTSFLVKKFHKN